MVAIASDMKMTCVCKMFKKMRSLIPYQFIDENIFLNLTKTN